MIGDDGKKICLVIIRCAKMLITLLEALCDNKEMSTPK